MGKSDKNGEFGLVKKGKIVASDWSSSSFLRQVVVFFFQTKSSNSMLENNCIFCHKLNENWLKI